MSEEAMLQLAQDALTARGIDDRLLAVGQFNPRGHTGGMFAGGLIGDDVGGSIGVGAGSIAGMRAADAASGLPEAMLVGVSDSHVYGLAAKTRHSEPTEIVFQLPRSGVTAKVHQRVNVRILELIDDASGSRIELEGNRLPVTHSRDVIDQLATHDR
jgi:hypothetical protein